MKEKISTVKTLLTVMSCFLLGYLVSSCSGSKNVTEASPVIKEEKMTFDPAKHFDASALRIYNMSASYPNSLQRRMISTSLDSFQIKLTTQTKASNGVIQYQEDGFQPIKNSLIEMGTMGKLVLALVCTKKMEAYKMKGINYSSTMIIESAGRNLSGAYNDPYAPQGRPSIGQYLVRMLTYNDVEAYNRVLEFVTTEQVNEYTKFNGWNATTITSRIGRPFTQAENASMNTINFYDDNNRKIFIQPNSISSQSNIRKKYANTTSLDDMESILLSLCTNQFRSKELIKQIGEDPLENLKLLLFNPKHALPYTVGVTLNVSSSIFFPNIKSSDELMVLPLSETNDRGMSEVVYYNDLNKGKVFVLSCSLLFKASKEDKGYEKELKEAKRIFEELGQATLNQLQN